MKTLAVSILRAITIYIFFIISLPHCARAQTSKADLIDSIRQYSKAVLKTKIIILKAEQESLKASFEKKETMAYSLIILTGMAQQEEYTKRFKELSNMAEYFGLTSDELEKKLEADPSIKKLISQMEKLDKITENDRTKYKDKKIAQFRVGDEASVYLEDNGNTNVMIIQLMPPLAKVQISGTSKTRIVRLADLR